MELGLWRSERVLDMRNMGVLVRLGGSKDKNIIVAARHIART
jgi:hypothetical protein